MSTLVLTLREAVPVIDTTYFYLYGSDEAVAAFLEASKSSLTELALNNIISVRYQVINMPYLIMLLAFLFVCIKDTYYPAMIVE